MATSTLSPMASSMASPTSSHSPIISTVLPSDLDIATITKPTDAHVEDMLTSSDSGYLLLTKICAVLQNIGYDVDTVRKVAGLVVKNLKSQHGQVNHLSDLVRDLVCSGTLKVDSNEPVLLMQAGKDVAEVTIVRDAVLSNLRDIGILPVRVYIATSEEDEEISVTLLNVVNTDIGGPSMIQLLDAAFHDNWKDTLMVKEAWRERDLIWRDESGLMSKTIAKVVGDAYIEGASSRTQSQTASEGPLYTPVSPILDSITPQVKETCLKEVEDKDEIIEEAMLDEGTVDVTEVPNHHPAWKELEERDAARLPVAHPTFDDDRDSHSLLDLIRSQSMKIKSEKQEEIDNSTSGEALTRQESSPPRSKATDEDDYEVL